MKKTFIIFMVLCLTVTLLTVTPAAAGGNSFWPGLAVGLGSAILLGSILNPPRAYYTDYRPVPVYNPPEYCPPPPAFRERWVPGHWVESYGRYGDYERYWAPGYWERVY